MAQIELTRSKLALIDDEDFDYLNQWHWTTLESEPGRYYARRNIGKSPHLMHRLILQAPSEFDVDHVNGNGLDNRRKNLRLATKTQNNLNNNIRSDNKSGFIGVHYDSRRGMWIAMLKVNKKNTYIGGFGTPKEAAIARDRETIKHYGSEFPKLNFPS